MVTIVCSFADFDPGRDDPDGDGVLCGAGEPCSPLPGLKGGLWFLTNGGGSPYYAQEPCPWGDWWKGRPDSTRGFHFTSQEAVLIFEADERGLAMTAYSSLGEPLDHIDNLMDARR